MTQPSTYHRPATGARHATCNLTMECNYFTADPNPNHQQYGLTVEANSALTRIGGDGSGQYPGDPVANLWPVVDRNQDFSDWVEPSNFQVFNVQNGGINYFSHDNVFNGADNYLNVTQPDVYRYAIEPGLIPQNASQDIPCDQLPSTIYPPYGPALIVNSNARRAKNKIDVFPNPSNGVFNVTVSVSNSELDFIVVNSIGVVVKEGQLKSGLNNLDLTSQPDGIYLLKISGKSTTLINQKK